MTESPPRRFQTSAFFLVGSAIFVIVAVGLVLLDYRRLVPWLLLLVSFSNFMTLLLLRRSRLQAVEPASKKETPSS